MSQYTLEIATEAHLSNIIGWFQNQQQLTQWGGPGLEFGLAVPEFAGQIKLCELASFSLMNGSQICGFGQFYIRLGRHHFGRLAIAPEQRGKGLAYELLLQLATLAPLKQKANGFSLFVLQHNTPALKTYQNLGFEFANYPEDIPGGLENCRYMTADKVSRDRRLK